MKLVKLYIMPIIHNNRYLPLPGLLRPTLVCKARKKHGEIFEKISQIFYKIFQAKN